VKARTGLRLGRGALEPVRLIASHYGLTPAALGWRRREGLG